MSTPLIKYNDAKKALSAVVRIDEVKDIRDKAEAMRHYAMQARDRGLIDHATEIRLRAERRAGELLRGMEKNKGAVPGKTGRKGKPVLDPKIKLSDLNINKSQSSRWQKLADVPDDGFEELVTATKQKACAAVDRAQQPKPKPKPKRKQRAKREEPTKIDPAEIVRTCVADIELTVRVAMVGLNAEDRAGLFDQVEKAINAIKDHTRDGNGRADIVPLELAADRWTEH